MIGMMGCWRTAVSWSFSSANCYYILLLWLLLVPLHSQVYNPRPRQLIEGQQLIELRSTCRNPLKGRWMEVSEPRNVWPSCWIYQYLHDKFAGSRRITTWMSAYSCTPRTIEGTSECESESSHFGVKITIIPLNAIGVLFHCATLYFDRLGC